VRGAKLVLFDHIETNTPHSSRELPRRRTFWFNAHSVESLGHKLRALPRRKWTELLMEVVL
jgi:hypothetical protein